MLKPAIVKFLRDEYTSLGLIIQESTTSNRITVYNSNGIALKDYYFKMRNSDEGFWGPMKSIVDTLIVSNLDCTLLLVTDAKVYSLNKRDMQCISNNFKTNNNNQYLIFEEKLVNLINPFCYNL